MVERLFNLLQREWGGLHETALLLGSAAVLSQILAVVRDRLFAQTFGASASLDIYYAAFRIPDLLFVVLASFVSVTVLIPFLLDRLARGDESGRNFLDGVFTAFFISIVLVSGVVFCVVPYLTELFFPGIDGEAKRELSTLTRIMLLSPILLGVSNILGSVTQSLRKFFVYAASPVFYNLGIILGLVFFYPLWGLSGLAWGVVVGALLHAGIQIPAVLSAGLLPQFSFRIPWRELRAVLTLSLPRTIGLSLHQVVLLVLVALATRMPEGSVAIFNFSFNLQSVPLAIIGVSYSVAAFPTLARLFSERNMDLFLGNIMTAARHIIFWALPATVLLIVLRAQIVRTILGAGAFSWSDTRLTAAALALFGISVVAQCLILLLVRAYYAAGNTKTPLFINIFSSLATIAAAFFLVERFGNDLLFRYFTEALVRISDIEGSISIVLPLAYSMGMILNVALLFGFFRRDFGPQAAFPARAFMQSFLAAVIMGTVAYGALNALAPVLDTDTFLGIFLQGLVSGIAGIAVGVVLLRLMRNRELEEIIRAIRSRFWKANAIAPDAEEL